MAIDYNAAFTGAVARLVDFYDNMRPFSDCTLDLGWTHPNANLVCPNCAFSIDMCGAESMYTCVCCQGNSAWSDFMAKSHNFPCEGSHSRLSMHQCLHMLHWLCTCRRLAAHQMSKVCN